MFIKEAFEQTVSIEYFDIPSLYTFNEDGNTFFDILTSSDNISLFKCRSIQIIIMYKWLKLKERMLYLQFVPHITMVTVHLIWHVEIRPYRTSDPMC